MNGDNADEGNIFRGAAAAPGVLDQLRAVAQEVMGEEGRDDLLDIYGLTDIDTLDRAETTERLTALAEDARFYLPSEEVSRVWPKAAFYHLTPKSPFWTSRFPGECFHTQDLLYVCERPSRRELISAIWKLRPSARGRGRGQPLARKRRDKVRLVAFHHWQGSVGSCFRGDRREF